MNGVVAGCTGAVLVALVVGVAFGIALGLWLAEPKHRNAQLHEGDWVFAGITGNLVMWQRDEPKRLNCHDDHRAYVCTMVENTAHVDACECGKTRQGVYGQWL